MGCVSFHVWLRKLIVMACSDEYGFSVFYRGLQSS